MSLKCADFTVFKNISKYCKWRRYILFWIIFIKFHSKNFIQLRKTWLLLLHHNNRRVLPISMANHWKIFMSNFRIKWVEKNDVTLPWKFCNFTRLKFCGIFAFLVLASATAKTLMYWNASKYFFMYRDHSKAAGDHFFQLLEFEFYICTFNKNVELEFWTWI